MAKARKPRWDMDLYDSRFNRWMRWLAMHPAFPAFTLDTIQPNGDTYEQALARQHANADRIKATAIAKAEGR